MLFAKYVKANQTLKMMIRKELEDKRLGSAQG